MAKDVAPSQIGSLAWGRQGSIRQRRNLRPAEFWRLTEVSVAV